MGVCGTSGNISDVAKVVQTPEQIAEAKRLSLENELKNKLKRDELEAARVKVAARGKQNQPSGPQAPDRPTLMGGASSQPAYGGAFQRKTLLGQ